MQLILVDPNPALCEAWQREFHHHPPVPSDELHSSMGPSSALPGVEIMNGFIEDAPEFDCLVTAGNSFGLMDGGVDLAVARMFPGVETRVQRAIAESCLGELQVGQSLLVGTHSKPYGNLPLVAYTPTMRVPMSIAGTDAVYRAMFAWMQSVHRWNASRTMVEEIHTVICPGLGTKTGQVPPDKAARQMALAYRNILHPPERVDWAMAAMRHRLIEEAT